MNQRHFSLCYLLCALLLWGCDSGSGNVDDAAPGEDGLSPAADGLLTHDGGNPDAPGWPPAPDLSGFSADAPRTVSLGISWSEVIGQTPAWNHGATFTIWEFEKTSPTRSCSETQAGNCTAYADCTAGEQQPSPASLRLYPERVVFSGGSGPDIVLEQTDSRTAEEDRWQGGETVQVAVTGNPAAGIPDVELNLVFPPRGYVSTPYGMGQNKYKLYRQSALPLSWPAGEGEVEVKLKQGELSIECLFEASAGSGEVPLELMQLLAEDVPTNMDPSTASSLRWTISHQAPIQAGAFSGQFLIYSQTESGGSAQVIDEPAP